MKRLSLVTLICMSAAFAQQPMAHDHAAMEKPATKKATSADKTSTKPAAAGLDAFRKGVGNLHHPVSTKSPEAQAAFDEGLRLAYGFNHDEAVRSFERAAKADPKLAMAYWGIAWVKGPNYNLPIDAAGELAAYDALKKAQALASGAPQNEQDYISALSRRYSSDTVPNFTKLSADFKDAMKEVSAKYPDDLDAATIYAESMMDMNPWGLWHPDGTPWELTPEITRVLESVLRRNPEHMGAIHLYIHAVEASPNPERALAGANTLASLAPTSGHLVHMPAHIYSRTGDFDRAQSTNVKAAAQDEAYAKAGGLQGIYMMMYYSHNVHFIAYSASMGGNYAEAIAAANKLAAHVGPHVAAMPPLEGFMTVPIAVNVRFQKWDEILKLKQPGDGMKTTTALWHYARGQAFVGKNQLKEANDELAAFRKFEDATPEDQVFAMPINNKAKSVLKIADNVLSAKIALASNDPFRAQTLLREAVEIQDSLKYGEPPDWFQPVRETLGAALLNDGKAEEAEKVFRADLEKNPRNGRSLFGLSAALKAQGKDYDAAQVNTQFEAAWKKADTKLKATEM
jgi:tetratricopeptide (TPR) repeat protein